MTVPSRNSRLTEVDGIPALVIPGPGPLTGGITFRVGRTDDPTHKLGISHLIEHLALRPFHDVPFDYDGSVGHYYSQFSCSGSSVEVKNFLEALCDSFEHLEFDPIEKEFAVLAIEDAGRAHGNPSLLALERFGVTGPAAMETVDFGRTNITPEDVDGFRRHFYTRQNAVVWFSGEPPDDLRLALPDGIRRPPATASVKQISGPTYTEGREGEVAASFLAGRTRAADVGLSALRRRLYRKLRVEQGLTYDVDTHYAAYSTDGAYLVASADIDDANERAIEVFVETVRDFCQQGATQDEVDLVVERRRRDEQDPLTVVGQLQFEAENMLVGRERNPRETSLTAEEVNAEMAGAYASVMFVWPEDYEPGDELSRIEQTSPYSEHTVDGMRYRRLWSPFTYQDDVYVGDEGVSSVPRRHAGPSTVRFEDCVVLELHSGNAIRLLGKDGMPVFVQSHALRNGEIAVERIKAIVPKELQIPAFEDAMAGEMGEVEIQRFFPTQASTRLPTITRLTLAVAWVVSLIAMIWVSEDTYGEYRGFLDPLLVASAIAWFAMPLLAGLGYALAWPLSLVAAAVGIAWAIADRTLDPPNWQSEFIGFAVLLVVTLALTPWRKPKTSSDG